MTREQHQYHPYYCEENIWQLCGSLRDVEDAFVLLITNESRSIAMAEQRAGGVVGTVVWDYHAVLIGRRDGINQVWDFDTKLSFPCPATEWIFQSFERFIDLDAQYVPRFRLIDAAQYREQFASDRRHMKGPDGEWLQPPPAWTSPGDGHVLDRWLDLGRDEPGQLFDHQGFRGWLSAQDT